MSAAYTRIYPESPVTTARNPTTGYGIIFPASGVPEFDLYTGDAISLRYWLILPEI
ncbi:hypothetical protein [Escherichia coli]|uniref:hypothetical protein n=1 Tax=Escherichia coli TaxID=562 RepID=UPI0010EEB295|nr:hypothetical protein [Escherichia coli]GDO98908.1 hypothetical protein BvCmsNSNP012_01799 [Escherichia coli]